MHTKNDDSTPTYFLGEDTWLLLRRALQHNYATPKAMDAAVYQRLSQITRTSGACPSVIAQRFLNSAEWLHLEASLELGARVDTDLHKLANTIVNCAARHMLQRADDLVRMSRRVPKTEAEEFEAMEVPYRQPRSRIRTKLSPARIHEGTVLTQALTFTRAARSLYTQGSTVMRGFADTPESLAIQHQIKTRLTAISERADIASSEHPTLRRIELAIAKLRPHRAAPPLVRAEFGLKKA